MAIRFTSVKYSGFTVTLSILPSGELYRTEVGTFTFPFNYNGNVSLGSFYFYIQEIDQVFEKSVVPASPTTTPTMTLTPTVTPTLSVTSTQTKTPTPTPTYTPTPTTSPTVTPTPTITETLTPTETITPTPSITMESTPSPTPTNTETPTTTPTNTQTPTPTITPTDTPTPTPTPIPITATTYAVNYTLINCGCDDSIAFMPSPFNDGVSLYSDIDLQNILPNNTIWVGLNGWTINPLFNPGGLGCFTNCPCDPYVNYEIPNNSLNSVQITITLANCGTTSFVCPPQMRVFVNSTTEPIVVPYVP